MLPPSDKKIVNFGLMMSRSPFDKISKYFEIYNANIESSCNNINY